MILYLKKVLRILLPIYAIRVFAIQELRCIQGNDLSLEGLVSRLTTFELSNFDNYKPKKIESTFKHKVSLKELNEKKKKKYLSSDSDTNEEDVEQIEALLARRFHKGKGNFKGKLPIICFNCNEIGHIVARYLEKKNHIDSDKYKGRRNKDKKDYKDKGKKCYIAEEDDFDEHNDEVVYVAMKDNLMKMR